MRSLGPTETSRTRTGMFESPGGEKVRPSDSGQHLGTFLVVTPRGGYYWHPVAEARDAAQHPTMPRTPPANVSSVEDEEPWTPRQVTGLCCEP